MAELHRAGRLRQVELGRRLRLEKSTVSRLVTNLVNRGWVRRHAADDDGRGVHLELTDAGTAATGKLAAAREAKFAALLDRVPDDRRAALVAATRITVTYRDIPAGGEITYATDHPALVTALHAWFDAQVSDHGRHAEHG